MNQKDYLEIAKIIKLDKRAILTASGKDLMHHFCIRLANYFEKEANKHIESFKGRRTTKTYQAIKRENTFNKKQFLKDCGVEK